MLASLVILSFIATLANASNDNLIALAQIYRHGQRTPVFHYKNDPYTDKDLYWQGVDMGHLTNVGKLQQYRLGQFTRRRYADWLPEAYSPSDFFVEVTDFDRTHMSAQSNLYGLYPAKGAQKWLSTIDWQAIPVHFSDPTTVITLSYPCPLFLTLVDQVRNSDEIQEFDAQHDSLYKKLTDFSGENVTNFDKAAQVLETLGICKEAGLPLPSWIDESFPQPSLSIIVKKFESWSFTPKLKRLHAGPLFNDILVHLEKKLHDPEAHKFHMYSANDNCVFTLLQTMGHIPPEPIPFAGSLYFELRLVNSVNVVNVWYKANDNFTQINIRGCEWDCPLTTVKELLGDILIDSATWLKECNEAP